METDIKKIQTNFRKLQFKRQLELLKRMNYWVDPKSVINFFSYRWKKFETISYSSPITVNIALTQKCNLNCFFCAASELRFREIPDKKVDVYFMEQLLEHPYFKKALYFTLSGGEPLLLGDELEKIIMLLKKKNKISMIVTNGMLMTIEKMQSLKKAGLTRILFSAYTANREKLYEILPEINKIMPASVTKLLLKKDIEENIEDFFKDLHFYEDSGCLDVLLPTCKPYGSDENTSMTFFNDDTLYYTCLERVKKEFPNYNITLAQPISRDITRGEIVCRDPWHLINIDGYGNYSPCCGIADYSEKWGNLFSEDMLESSSNNFAVQELRQSLLNNQPLEMCKLCHRLKSDSNLGKLSD